MNAIKFIINFIDENKHSIILFLTVGILVAVFYISFFNFLWKFLALDYHIAFTISYGVSIVLYFFLSRIFTFKSRHAAVGPQVIRFIGMIIFNYLVTLAIVHSVVTLLALPPYIGIVVAIFMNTISNYLIAKLWVFSTGNKSLNHVTL